MQPLCLHTDVGKLLERVWAVGGFAGPPSDDEARLLIEQKSAAGLTVAEWEDELRDTWFEQRLQMDAMWRAEEELIAFLRSAWRSEAAGARELLGKWRAARLAAHQAAAYFGRDTLTPIESKAKVRRAEKWEREGRPRCYVLFDGARPAFVSAELRDWDDGNQPIDLASRKAR